MILLKVPLECDGKVKKGKKNGVVVFFLWRCMGERGSSLFFSCKYGEKMRKNGFVVGVVVV